MSEREVVEPSVPQYVIDAFEERYSRSFDLTRDDHEWRNTWRYKHDHIQSKWVGWRDGYLALAPQMLAALKGMAEQTPKSGGDPLFHTPAEQLMFMAIAKAEGRDGKELATGRAALAREGMNWLWRLAEHADWYGWRPTWLWRRLLRTMDRRNGYELDYDD